MTRTGGNGCGIDVYRCCGSVQDVIGIDHEYGGEDVCIVMML